MTTPKTAQDTGQKLSKLHFHDELAGFQHRQGWQCFIKDVIPTHGSTHILIKGDAHRALVHDPRFALIIHDYAGTQKLRDTLIIEFPAEILLGLQKKRIFSRQNFLKFRAGQDGILLIDPAAELLFALQLNDPVTVVINADAVFFAQQHTGLLFFIGGVPVIVKVQAANKVPAAAGMRIHLQDRAHPCFQCSLFPIGNQIFQLVAVSLCCRARRRCQQGLHNAGQIFSPPHRYPPQCCRQP